VVGAINQHYWASTLDKSEVERMVKQAEQNAATDKERREKVDRKN